MYPVLIVMERTLSKRQKEYQKKEFIREMLFKDLVLIKILSSSSSIMKKRISRYREESMNLKIAKKINKDICNSKRPISPTRRTLIMKQIGPNSTQQWFKANWKDLKICPDQKVIPSIN